MSSIGDSGGIIRDWSEVEADGPGAADAGGETSAILSPELRDPGLEAVARGQQTLTSGSRGSGVKLVQQALVTLGASIGADGSFGPKTVAALKEFQQGEGLPASGRLDSATLAALDRALFAQDESKVTAASGAGDDVSIGGAVPPAYAAALARAAATPRSQSVTGREGILSGLQVQNAATAFGDLTPSERATVSALVDGASVGGQADASPAQALILKSLAAHQAVFAGSDAAARAQAISELTAFANGIHGLDFPTLMQKTSLLDIDATTDTSAFDPLSLDDAPEHPTTYTGADNDGLFQRYEESCGPASIEVLLGELDPAYAFRRRSEPMGENPAPADDIQTQMVQQFGLTPASRVIPQEVAKLRGAMSSLEQSGRLTPDEAKQVTGYLLGAPDAPKGALVDGGLAKIRAASGGFPDPEQAAEIRAYAPPDPSKKYSNVGFDNITKMLNKVVGSELGVSYSLHSLYDPSAGSGDPAGRSPAFVRSNLDQLASSLAGGKDAVFGTSYPDHFWSMSSVQGESPDRQFLVHDTWSGRTGWVPEGQLVDGTFAKAFLGQGKTSTFIDLLYIA